MDSQQIAAVRLRECQQAVPPTIGPQSIGIALTNACNLNCVTCWSYSALRSELPRLEWRHRRLSREVLQRLFQDAKRLHTERVIFTGGGDPLAHPHFLDIAGDAKSAGLKVTLISNLTLARDPDRLAALHLDTVLANFSSGDPESYAAFHPNRNAAEFPKLIETLQLLRDNGTAIKLVFVVCLINYQVMEKTIRIASELRATIQWKRVSVTAETSPLDLSDTIRATILSDLESLMVLADSLHVVANWEVFSSELKGQTLADDSLSDTGCHAGHYYSRVGANGDVRFCCNANAELMVRNLNDANFAEIWHSATYASLRQNLSKREFVSGCEQCGKLDLNRRVWRDLAMLGSPSR